MFQLKQEFKDYRDNNIIEIDLCREIFYQNDQEYLKVKQLPKSWKERIDKIWYKSPLSKIQSGFTDLMYAEQQDLKNDNFCKKNLNKEYWLKSYMLCWLSCMPDEADAEYLYNHLMTRQANRILIEKAYERVK